MAKRSTTSNVYFLTVYVFGYDLRVIGRTPDEARKAMLREIKKGCRAQGGTPKTILSRSAEEYLDDYTEATPQEMPFGKVEWC